MKGIISETNLSFYIDSTHQGHIVGHIYKIFLLRIYFNLILTQRYPNILQNHIKRYKLFVTPHKDFIQRDIYKSKS